DVAALPCVPERRPPLRRLLGLGRYAPVKGWETVLEALPALPDATLAVHGPMLTDADRAHRPYLEARARELGVADRVTFGEAVPYAAVPHLFGLADAVVNATRGNAADKVVYEAAAACLPVFASSPVFDTLLPEELRFHGDYPDSLADRIRSYGGGAGRDLRARVEAEHSVDHWAERVLEEAVAAVVDHRVLAAAPEGLPTGDERFRLVGPARPRMLDGALYYALLPFRI